jgi:outer membrane protein assembly factor BamB
VTHIRRMRRIGAGLALVALIAGCTPAGSTSPASANAPTSGAVAASSSGPSPTPVPVQVPPKPTGPLPGYLLIADRGNDRMMLVDGSKHILWRYPKPGATPSMPFAFDDDTFFTPDHTAIISNQEDQETLQVISFPDGKIRWRYGHVNTIGSSPGYLHTPDDAYMLPDGTRTVADISNCRILFLDAKGTIVKQYGTTGVCRHDPPAFLALPNGDTPMPDGGTLVTEITGSWIDAIGANGKLEWSVRAPIAYPSDAQWLGHGKILVADYSYTGHVLIMTKAGKVLWEYGPTSGPGRLSFPSLALMLPNGLVAVNDDVRDRVVLIDPKTNRIVWQYGKTDVAGTARGLLNRPDGMDFVPYDVAVQTPVLRRYLVRVLGQG